MALRGGFAGMALGVLAALVVGAAGARAQNGERGDGRRPPLHVQGQQARIKEEIAGLGDHPWAGVYLAGGKYGGTSLHISPEGGFVYSESFDMGLMTWSSGRIERVEDGFILLQRIAGWNDQELPGPPDCFAFLRVHWGKRHYLVRADEGRDFLRKVAKGKFDSAKPEFGNGWQLVRDSDRPLERVGVPTVPESIRRLILEGPEVGNVVEVSEPVVRDDRDGPEYQVATTRVKLDVGSAKGIEVGTQFIREDGTWRHPVVEVGEGWCVVEVTQIIKPGDEPWRPSKDVAWATRVSPLLRAMK